MKIGKWARVMLAAAPLLAGCGDFWQAPSGGGGGTCTTNCSTATSGNFYILNGGTTPQVLGYSIVSGALTKLTGSPYTAPASPNAIAIAHNASAVFVGAGSGVTSYAIGTGGALGTGISISSSAANAIVVDSTSAWLIAAAAVSGGAKVQLSAIPLGSGATQTVTYTASGASVMAIAISPDNLNIFVALGPGGTMVVPFTAGTTANPTTTPLAATAAITETALHGGQAISVAVDYNNRMFYVGETKASTSSSGGLRLFNYTSLSEMTGSPYSSGGATPNAILPAVQSVYVANSAGAGSAGNIAQFNIVDTPSCCTLTSGSTAATGNNPVGLVQDNTDTYVFVVNAGGNPYFQAYTYDTTTAGKLDPQLTSNTGATPVAIAAVPPG